MRPSRRLIVIALDVLTVGLVMLLATIVSVGGFVVRFWGLRISAGTPGRTLLWLGATLLVRRSVEAHRPVRDVVRALAAAAVLDRRRSVSGACARAILAAHGVRSPWNRGALAILLHDQLRQMYSVPDLGDPLFSMWRIGWVAHQIVTDPAHLFDADIFYPERLTLALSDPTGSALRGRGSVTWP